MSIVNQITDDTVNHPSHYTNGGMECIDEMILVFGKEAVAKARSSDRQKNKGDDLP